ncbi:MAG: hypothetical protein V7L29_22585 [Nostoc sp.]
MLAASLRVTLRTVANAVLTTVPYSRKPAYRTFYRKAFTAKAAALTSCTRYESRSKRLSTDGI